VSGSGEPFLISVTGQVAGPFVSVVIVAVLGALAIQRDGKLVAAGRSRVTALSDDSAVGRYSARGRLDSSFGRGGKVLTDFGSRKRVSGWANAVAIQADGKLVVAGSSGIIADGPWRFALSRYTARGKLDPTFGSGGKVLTRFGPVSDSAVAVAIQRDGKIVAAGSDVRNHAVFALARYTPGGKLDPSFGSGGKVLTDLGLWSDARAVAIQADGKLVVAGVGRLSDFAVARYAADGKLDSSFGSGGKVMTNFRTGRSWEAGGRIRGSTSARGRECRLSRRSSTPARHRINPV
jgi:uncharacterized delta-60 repeat protein